MKEDLASVSSAKPRYRHVMDYIIAMIRSGKLKIGDQVPSENELVELLGVARMTANRALRELADDGYVTRLAGVGTFVADARPHSDVLRVRNIAHEIRARGHEHSATVIKLEEVFANERLAERLKLRTGARVFHSVILHLEDGQPIQYEDRYVHPSLAPDYLGIDFTKETPNAYLTGVAPLHTAEHIIRASVPSAEVRHWLQMAPDEPCLVIKRRTWTEGRPVSLAELSHPGGSYELIGTLGD